ncbi:MAG TPA: hypothetical protein TECP_00815 [Hyphomicrobiaceae bacterium MAG_BT-2024]
MLFIVLGLVVAGLIAFIVGVARIKIATNINPTIKMHSRVGYYGTYSLIWTTVPALIVTLLWSSISPHTINMVVKADIMKSAPQLTKAEHTLIMGHASLLAERILALKLQKNEILLSAQRSMATAGELFQFLKKEGVVFGGLPQPHVISAALNLVVLKEQSLWFITSIASVLSLVGFLYAFIRVRPRMQARNSVEAVVLAGFIFASMIAVLTTFGIVASVVFETVEFFNHVSLDNFFLGTTWDPRFTSADLNRGEGQFGFLPLLWGTLYITFVSLLFAVPIGLHTAVYLSEYASTRFRNVVKPLLEILAGIPTIVYGFFALITFGPFLRDTGAILGFDITSTSVLSAGMVMGIMIIPFVSSLSDDIISAVPQSLREGSYGLGATKSETIRRIILPAALPGIVGAVLLAASRAIGETMIVVLAAGIAANLTINPLEPVTTITVKIVSQLTGDLEFNSPQTLVAFALGLTLFMMTLILNIYALYIVRKYKEQYD